MSRYDRELGMGSSEMRVPPLRSLEQRARLLIEADENDGINALVPVDIPLAEVMSRDVVCVDPSTSVEELRDLFLERNISGAPVVDSDNRPIGIVTKTDLVREQALDEPMPESERLRMTTPEGYECELGEGFHLVQIPRAVVRDIMAPFALTLPAEATLARAAALMAFEGIHQVIVTGRDGRVAGVVSSMDLAHWIARHASSRPLPPPPPPRPARRSKVARSAS